jgi:hypothetical protein
MSRTSDKDYAILELKRSTGELDEKMLEIFRKLSARDLWALRKLFDTVFALGYKQGKEDEARGAKSARGSSGG